MPITGRLERDSIFGRGAVEAGPAQQSEGRFGPLHLVEGSLRPRAVRRAAGAGRVKVLLYSHDTFGLGHLRRNLAIAERLLASQGRFSITLLTGSPVVREWRLPRGLCVLPMPPVVKIGAERYAAREPG
ncbi:MAG: hypothetical protein M0002_06930 [Rhodospirillales bacterium]|nr:hypothetical protein [Rhodospirillales bacterium]